MPTRSGDAPGTTNAGLDSDPVGALAKSPRACIPAGCAGLPPDDSFRPEGGAEPAIGLATRRMRSPGAGGARFDDCFSPSESVGGRSRRKPGLGQAGRLRTVPTVGDGSAEAGCGLSTRRCRVPSPAMHPTLRLGEHVTVVLDPKSPRASRTSLSSRCPGRRGNADRNMYRGPVAVSERPVMANRMLGG